MNALGSNALAAQVTPRSNSPALFVDEQGLPFSHADLKWINFGATSYEEILQNLKTILLTPIYSVPLDRLFGMQYLFVDEPTNDINILVAEFLQKLQGYENRCEILDVEWQPDEAAAESGHMIPVIRLRLRNVTYETELSYDSFPKHTWPP